jgi:hypothetical protein
MNHPNLLQKSNQIVVSFFPWIVFLFFVEAFGDTYLSSKNSMGLFLLVLFFKILLLAGFYGSLAHIVKGEALNVSKGMFFNNIKRIAPMYGLLLILPFFVQSGLINLGIKVSLLGISVVWNLIILYFLAYFVLEPLSKNKVTQKNLSFKEGFGLLLLIGLYILSFVPSRDFLYRANIIGFVQCYLEVFIFVYLVFVLKSQRVSLENDSKKIIFVNPPAGGLINYLGSIFIRTRHHPVFIILNALSPKTYSVEELNQGVWHERYFQGQALIAITCYTSNSAEAYTIAKGYKNAGAKVIMGGPHVSYLPSEALEYCDSVVVGEVEGVWDKILNDYEHNNLQKLYTGSASKETMEKVYASLLDAPAEVAKDLLQISRGCKFKCHFCTIPGLSGHEINLQIIDQVSNLLKHVKDKFNYVTFIDNNIYNDPAYAKELFQAIRPLGVKWNTMSTIDIAKNDDVLKLAKESGCQELLIGYELTDVVEGKKKGGKLGMVEQYLKYTEKIKALGIKVRAQFIFGFDHDHISDLGKLWRYCFKMNPFLLGLSILTPLPGSKLFDEMLMNNRIVNLNWRKYAMLDFVFRHKNIPPALMFLFPIIKVLMALTTSTCGRRALLAFMIIVGSIVVLSVKGI